MKAHDKCMLGLTLIEVLIALAIVSIALTSIIKATAQNIKTTYYLQNKTIALWIGQTILNEARLGLLPLPEGSETALTKMSTLNRDWYWQAAQYETSNKQIKKIKVRIFNYPINVSPLIELEGYVYHQI